MKEKFESLEQLPIRITLDSMEIDIDKPLIAIVSAQNELDFANCEIEQTVKKARDGVISANATAKILPITSAPTSKFGMTSNKYEIFNVEHIAESIEVLASSQMIDGFVFVANNPSTQIGMLIGAIRVNIPCIFVSAGLTLPQRIDNAKPYGTDLWTKIVGFLRAGAVSLSDASQIEKMLPILKGSNVDEYQDNSISCVLETLGLATRGNCTAFAHSKDLNNIAHSCGASIVKMVNDNMLPSKILTKNSLISALCFDLTMGGNSNTVLYLLALAENIKNYLKIDTITLSTVDDYCKKVPLLVKKDINIEQTFMEQFANCGGVYAVLKQLEKGKIINCNYQIFNGKFLNEEIDNFDCAKNMIADISTPFSNNTNIKVIYGNVAESGALLRYVDTTAFIGPAKVYENEEMAVNAIMQREIKKGNVLVIKNETLSSSGLREMYLAQMLLVGLGLEKDVAIVTNGRISCDYFGMAVGHICPCSTNDNVVNVINDGDIIEIAPNKSKINVDIKTRDIVRRLSSKNTTVNTSPIIKVFANNMTTPNNGCTLNLNKK